ncbi:hypothetical protein BX661DRAFT_183693 [Kickxella alabastrina]|uniref:uncharacterized protein n=1 Tax=Kickxella alabastrina TaxID=61397 RepID=UPI00221FBBDF|nr:uncharacterized protein BX661DRAFT_183693 [Kickxella alabastrina]KAI7826252.1 hypothetical protein BX661DRAFT_183693 [Kickxella alabastrina]
MDFNFNFNPPDPNLPDQYIAHASDLLTQIVFSTLLGGTAFVAFCLLRSRWPDVYAPRARLLFAAPARIGKSLLGWISMTLDAKDYDIMYSVGLDALLVLRLFKMLGALSATASLIGLLVLVPLKVILDPQQQPKDGSGSDSGRSLYESITTAAMGSERPLIVHFAFAYVFTALVYYYFSRFAYQAISLRWHYLLRVRNTRPAKSVMVTGIPTELAAEHELKDHFERSGCGQVVSVEIVPRIERLGEIVRRRAGLLQLIEEKITLILGNPCTAIGYDRDRLQDLLNAHHTDDHYAEAWQLLRQWSMPRYRPPKGARKLDALVMELEYLLRRFHHADGVIGQVRREWFASYDGRRDRSSTVGFVTFANASSAHLAAQSFTYAQPFKLRTELAPEARDVFWENVALPLIDALKEYFPRLPEFVDKNKWLKGLFRFTTPTFMLSLMNACVPFFLSWIARVSGIQSRSGIQKSVLKRYFLFLIVNVLLIFTVSRTILTDYDKWIENPARIPKLFATSLPTAAPFFMDYIILYGLGYYPIQLLQLGSISLAVFRRMVCRTPRQFADALRPNYIDWSFILPQPMLVFVIMATYSSLAPFIFVLAFLYYGIAYVVTKYLVYYVYARQFETAGEFIIPVLKLLTGSLWHYYCLIIGLCALKGAVGYMLMLFPLLWINRYLLSDVSRQFYENAKFLPLDLWSVQGTKCNGYPAAATATAATLEEEEEEEGGFLESQDTNVHESHATSTDYLLPRAHVPSPFGQLLDAIDSESRGSATRLWEYLHTRLQRLWTVVFSKIYIDPQAAPEIFRDLDRSYSINIPMSLESEPLSGTLSRARSFTAILPSLHPRFSTTFEDNGGDFLRNMRAELMLVYGFEQSPISLLDGVLDQGLAVYEHPYLIGHLPTLWLPMKRQENILNE